MREIIWVNTPYGEVSVVLAPGARPAWTSQEEFLSVVTGEMLTYVFSGPPADLPAPVRFSVRETELMFGSRAWDCTLAEHAPEKIFTVRCVYWTKPRPDERKRIWESLFWQLADYKEALGEQ